MWELLIFTPPSFHERLFFKFNLMICFLGHPAAVRNGEAAHQSFSGAPANTPWPRLPAICMQAGVCLYEHHRRAYCHPDRGHDRIIWPVQCTPAMENAARWHPVATDPLSKRCPGSGWTKIILNMEYVQHLIENRLPIVTVAKVLGVFRKTLYRRLADHNLPGRRHQYSSCTDAELDELVSQLKQWWPHSGTRIQRVSFVSCTDLKRNM